MNGDEPIWMAATPREQRKRKQTKQEDLLQILQEALMSGGGTARPRERQRQPEVIPAMGRILTPQQRRLATGQPAGSNEANFLLQMRELLTPRGGTRRAKGEAGETDEDKQEKERLKAEQDKQKQEWSASKDKATYLRNKAKSLIDAAKDDPANSDEYHKRAAELTNEADKLMGLEEPGAKSELTPEERMAIGGARAASPARIPEIDKQLGELQAKERDLNKEYDEAKTQEERDAIWAQMTKTSAPGTSFEEMSVSEQIKSLAQEKSYYEEMMAREPELAAYEQAIEAQAKHDEYMRQQETIRAAAADKAGWETEQRALRPPETALQAGERELGLKVREAGETTAAREAARQPYRETNIALREAVAKRKAEQAASNQELRDMRLAEISGNKTMRTKMIATLTSDYTKTPDEGQQKWIDNRKNVDDKLRVSYGYLGYLKRQGYEESDAEMLDVNRDIAERVKEREGLGKKPAKTEKLEAYIKRRLKEVDNTLGLSKSGNLIPKSTDLPSGLVSKLIAQKVPNIDDFIKRYQEKDAAALALAKQLGF